MSHYLLEESVTKQPSPYTTFFYPPKMFSDTQTTLNVLVTLEDAFIAAYLVGVRDFSTRDLRVTAARIMGIESDHRTLARIIGPDVSAMDGGPIEMITGLSGMPESVDPPNNNGYERTACWTKISQAVAALTPFVDMTAAKAAGFDITKPYVFQPFRANATDNAGCIREFQRLLGAARGVAFPCSSGSPGPPLGPGNLRVLEVAQSLWLCGLAFDLVWKRRPRAVLGKPKRKAKAHRQECLCYSSPRTLRPIRNPALRQLWYAPPHEAATLFGSFGS